MQRHEQAELAKSELFNLARQGKHFRRLREIASQFYFMLSEFETMLNGHLGRMKEAQHRIGKTLAGTRSTHFEPYQA